MTSQRIRDLEDLGFKWRLREKDAPEDHDDAAAVADDEQTDDQQEGRYINDSASFGFSLPSFDRGYESDSSTGSDRLIF